MLYKLKSWKCVQMFFHEFLTWHHLDNNTSVQRNIQIIIDWNVFIKIIFSCFKWRLPLVSNYKIFVSKSGMHCMEWCVALEGTFHIESQRRRERNIKPSCSSTEPKGADMCPSLVSSKYLLDAQISNFTRRQDKTVFSWVVINSFWLCHVCIDIVGSSRHTGLHHLQYSFMADKV